MSLPKMTGAWLGYSLNNWPHDPLQRKHGSCCLSFQLITAGVHDGSPSYDRVPGASVAMQEGFVSSFHLGEEFPYFGVTLYSGSKESWEGGDSGTKEYEYAITLGEMI